ncbi:hypothetical protein B0J17DRAFT_678403 [Rhizoctonia solani]|nr:hypothetical protein B0J17DRAFT_678403 [Rhizoctonia solani]
MDQDTGYTVTVQNRDFLLTESQIVFDAPNYFLTCFSGDFKEAQTRHLYISRDPGLFQIISDYMCGYAVLPLSNHAIPARMSPELALVNLKADAVYYELDGLVEQCNTFLLQEQKKIKDKPEIRKMYSILGCEYECSSSLSFGEITIGRYATELTS